MTDDGECTCDGDEFSIMSDEPGLCVCDIEKDSFVTNNQCRTCTGVGNLIEEDDEFKCVCGNNAALTWETIGYVCTCNIGYLEGDDKNCYKCDDGLFNPADQTCSCDPDLADDADLAAMLPNKVLNEAADACVCDDTFVLSFLDNKCYKCDVSQQLVSRFDHDNDECLCVGNAEFIDDECVCSEGYKQYEKTCVRCDGELDNSGECTCEEGFLFWNYGCISCSGFNARINQGECTCGQFEFLNDDNECVCEEGYMLHNNACIRCAGVGSSLDDDGNCICADNAHLTLTSTGLSCTCMADYFLADDDTCNLCIGGIGDPASKECTCVGDNFVFNADENKCECDSGFVTSSLGECIRCNIDNPFFRFFFNDICQCKVGAVLDEDTGECACDASEYLIFNDDTCVRCDSALGGSVLDDGTCGCAEEGYIYNPFTFGCVQCSGLNAKLNDDGECVCGLFEVFNEGTFQCECVTDYIAYEPEDDFHYCVSCRGFRSELNDDGECVCTDDRTFLQLIDGKQTYVCQGGVQYQLFEIPYFLLNLLETDYFWLMMVNATHVPMVSLTLNLQSVPVPQMLIKQLIVTQTVANVMMVI